MSNLKTVSVLFNDNTLNYKTSVNGECSEESLRKYFVGKFFDMGSFPVENMQKCINIEIL